MIWRGYNRGTGNKINTVTLKIISPSIFKDFKAKLKSQLILKNEENHRRIHTLMNPAHLQEITSITGHTHTQTIKICIALMDGQPSLWEESQRQFGKGSLIEVLDILHVTPRLWDVANIFHPEDKGAHL